MRSILFHTTLNRGVTLKIGVYADNILQASTEIHVFWVIIVALVLKIDLSNEKYHQDIYDLVLVITGFALVAFPLAAATFFKVYKAFGIRTSGKDPVAEAVARYREGMATDDDMCKIRTFLKETPLQAAIQRQSQSGDLTTHLSLTGLE